MQINHLKALPKIVSATEWEAARAELLVKEKAATRQRDALAAERRRLPMVRIEKDYVFEGPDGKASLVDLFEGRRQLILYHFMFAPTVDGWPEAGCPGAESFSSQRDSMIVAWHGVPGTAPPQKSRPVGYGMIRAGVRTDSKIGGRKFRMRYR